MSLDQILIDPYFIHHFYLSSAGPLIFILRNLKVPTKCYFSVIQTIDALNQSIITKAKPCSLCFCRQMMGGLLSLMCNYSISYLHKISLLEKMYIWFHSGLCAFQPGQQERWPGLQFEGSLKTGNMVTQPQASLE